MTYYRSQTFDLAGKDTACCAQSCELAYGGADCLSVSDDLVGGRAVPTVLAGGSDDRESTDLVTEIAALTRGVDRVLVRRPRGKMNTLAPAPSASMLHSRNTPCVTYCTMRFEMLVQAAIASATPKLLMNGTSQHTSFPSMPQAFQLMPKSS